MARPGAGHLGELTPLVPFGLVDEVLAQTVAEQPGRCADGRGRVPVPRRRVLPDRVTVYFILAMVLCGQVGYAGVWAKLTTAVPSPVSGAFVRARRRIGSAPLAALFARLAGGSRSGASCFGLRLAAVDGTCCAVPDSAANRQRFGKHKGRHGTAGYPLVRVVALLECGTRALVGAVFDSMAVTENDLALRLFTTPLRGWLILADRGFDCAKAMNAVADTGADLLFRIKSNRKTVPVGRPAPDGSYLAVVSGRVLRIVQAQVRLTTADGVSRSELWRLATTVTDYRTAPAVDLVACYHRRWEVETGFLGLKCTILKGRVLRSASPDLVDQEAWALLCVYQLLTTAITLSLAGTGIPRHAGSFTEAVQAAQDQIVRAQGIMATADSTLAVIRDRVRHRPVEQRTSPRHGPRSVKRPLSKYAYTDLGAAKTTQKADIHIAITELDTDTDP